LSTYQHKASHSRIDFNLAWSGQQCLAEQGEHVFASAFCLNRVIMPVKSFTRLAACRAALLCAVLACSCLVQLTAAQFGMPGMGMDKPPKAAAVKSDVQYIKCQACEALVKQAYRHTKSKREGLKPGQKVCG
jgi:hypothetical protein